MNIKTFTKGQTAYMCDRDSFRGGNLISGNAICPVRVTKIGRTYVTVAKGNIEYKFF